MSFQTFILHWGWSKSPPLSFCVLKITKVATKGHFLNEEIRYNYREKLSQDKLFFSFCLPAERRVFYLDNGRHNGEILGREDGAGQPTRGK